MVDLRDAAQRIERLTPLADALAYIDRSVAPVAPRSVEARAACGLTLAADIVAAGAHPAVALALRDGFAVPAEATLDASAYAPAALAGLPAALELGDRALTERLAVVDPFAFPDVNALREHLVTIVQDHLRGRDESRRVEFDRAFHFQRSDLVEVPLGLTATNLTEFRAGLANVDASAIYLHIVDTVALVHALVLRMQAVVLPLKALVFGGH